MKTEYNMEPNMHLTCTNMPVELIGKALEGCKAADIRNIVALRGDAPKGQETWTASDGGFTCALDLVVHMRKQYGDFFHISVAGYPEGHPVAITKVAPGAALSESERSRLVTRPDGDWVCTDAAYAGELAYLKKKVDAGADMIITQMFFDSNVFLKFVKDCRAAGFLGPAPSAPRKRLGAEAGVRGAWSGVLRGWPNSIIFIILDCLAVWIFLMRSRCHYFLLQRRNKVSMLDM
jgi:methylenetetrahydrofolate reductase (NADPH)